MALVCPIFSTPAISSGDVRTNPPNLSCQSCFKKGMPIEERKIQRLFRNGNVTRLIKKSNDFGAGGVCVAIGELADGLEIDLNKVPLKYQGLNGTEIAISESQERMAVVVRPEDVAALLKNVTKKILMLLWLRTVTENQI